MSPCNGNALDVGVAACHHVMGIHWTWEWLQVTMGMHVGVAAGHHGDALDVAGTRDALEV